MDSLISVSFKQVTLSDALDEISTQSGVLFSYNSELVSTDQTLTLIVENQPVRIVLNQLLSAVGLTFEVVNGQVVLQKLEYVEKSSIISHALEGMVTDELGNPISGVNVFLASSTKGSSTNANGRFEIQELESGNYHLVASHISYEIVMMDVFIPNDEKVVAINFSLLPRVSELQELQVVSIKNKEWEKYYSIFEKEFLGRTRNSRKCEILNPESLDFEFDHDQNSITVSARQPLKIANQALGYEVEYFLKQFQISPQNTQAKGVSYFSELTPKNKRVERRWLKNRLKSYNGSLHHFLKSVINGNPDQEGFKLYLMGSLPVEHDVPAVEVDWKDIVEVNKQGTEKRLRFSQFLKIEYLRDKESSAYVSNQLKHAMGVDPYSKNYNVYVQNNVALDWQTSFMKLNKTYVTIDFRGYFKEPLAVSTFGYWSWERLAEYLPRDFSP